MGWEIVHVPRWLGSCTSVCYGVIYKVASFEGCISVHLFLHPFQTDLKLLVGAHVAIRRYGRKIIVAVDEILLVDFRGIALSSL